MSLFSAHSFNGEKNFSKRRKIQNFTVYVIFHELCVADFHKLGKFEAVNEESSSYAVHYFEKKLQCFASKKTLKKSKN